MSSTSRRTAPSCTSFPPHRRGPGRPHGCAAVASPLPRSSSPCWCSLPFPSAPFGGSTLAQAAPAQGQEYIVKAGDTLASIATRADPEHSASLTESLVRETGTNLVVPGEHIFIP